MTLDEVRVELPPEPGPVWQGEQPILEGRAVEPTEVLEGLDAVTAEDVERVAADVLAGELQLALIGPFDEPGRFEPLLAA